MNVLHVNGSTDGYESTFLRMDAIESMSPWEQADRSRWGEGNSYYSKERFDAERRSEARLLVEQYGEMARMTLPPDLLDGVVTD